MRTQVLCTIGAYLSLVSLIVAAPALKYSGSDDICGVTTVYVTVSPVVDTIKPIQVVGTTLSGDNIISTAGPGKPSGISTASVESSSQIDTPHTAHLTTTVHEIISLTHTVFAGLGTTITKTLVAFEPSESQRISQKDVGKVAHTSSADTLGISSTAGPYGSHIPTEETFGTTESPVEPSKTPCSEDLLNPTVGNPTAYPIDTAAATTSIVVIFETLTVIPLSTLPPVMSNDGKLTTYENESSAQPTSSTTTTLQLTASTSPRLSASNTNVTWPMASAPSSGDYSSSGARGWNCSVSSITTLKGLPVSSQVISLTVRPGFTTFPSGSIPSLSYVSESVDFSNSYISSIPVSNLAAQSGFTDFLGYSSGARTSISAILDYTSTAVPTATSTMPMADTTYAEGYDTMSTGSPVNSSTIYSASSLEVTSSFLTSSLLTTTSGTSSTPANYTSGLRFTNMTSTASPISPSANYSSELSLDNLASTATPTPSATSISSSSEFSFGSVTSTSSTSSPNPASSLETLGASSSGPAMTMSSISSLSTSVYTGINSFTSFANSTSTVATGTRLSTSTPLPKPTVCGEHGSFTLNFDDLPPLSVFDNATAQPMPLFSPYHQFFFSDGFTVVPPPTDPYLPSSGRLLLEFLADPGSVLGDTGSIGNGRTAQLGCFNFNAAGISVGCDSKGPDCDWQFTGLRYNFVSRVSDVVTIQHISTPACPGLSNCRLVPIFLDSTFQNLTSLQMNVTVNGEHKIWWMDDLNLSWFDDSCDAGLCRVENI